MRDFRYRGELTVPPETIKGRLLDQAVLQRFVAMQQPESNPEILLDRESSQAHCSWTVVLPLGLGSATVVFEIDLRAEGVKADMETARGATAHMEGSLLVSDGDSGGVISVAGHFTVRRAPIPFAERALAGVPRDLLDELRECIENA